LEIKSLILDNYNYKTFCIQCEAAIVEFPNLSVFERNGLKYLKGILDIKLENTSIIGSYFIEIHFTEMFPNRFPDLFEIGKDIPNEADWHKYQNGKCCITVLADEIIKCKAGITVTNFIKNYCLSFFANHIHRKQYDSYLNGYYNHGELGVFEFYAELFKTKNINDWLKYFKHVFRNTLIKIERNDFCFCKSQLKFKHCHYKIFNSLKDIGEQQCLNDFTAINNFINKFTKK
jgi:SEC-C motif